MPLRMILVPVLAAIYAATGIIVSKPEIVPLCGVRVLPAFVEVSQAIAYGILTHNFACWLIVVGVIINPVHGSVGFVRR